MVRGGRGHYVGNTGEHTGAICVASCLQLLCTCVQFSLHFSQVRLAASSASVRVDEYAF